MNQVTAKLNYLKITPRKVRSVVNGLKGLPVVEAEAQLLIRSRRSAPVILKLLRSAVANAKNKKMDSNKLVVSSILVNQGPIMKRFLPRAQGRATPLQKKTSHIVLTLSESDQIKPARFNILPLVKKEKKEKAKKTIKPKTVETKETKAAVEEKPNFFRRVFRRKSV